MVKLSDFNYSKRKHNIMHGKPHCLSKFRNISKINGAIFTKQETLTKNPTACLMCLSSSQDVPAYCKCIPKAIWLDFPKTHPPTQKPCRVVVSDDLIYLSDICNNSKPI